MKRKTLPGQLEEISRELDQLLKRVKAECAKEIYFKISSPESGFEGQAEWFDDKIIIELKPGLNHSIGEYIVAHELGHILQFVRGYAIAGGRADDPEAIEIAVGISDFVFDSIADSLANQHGFPIASGFDNYYRSSNLLGGLSNLADCRHFGTQWERIWTYLTEARINRRLRNRVPRIPREFRTLMAALDFANIIKRANNLNLRIGLETKAALSKQRIVSKVIDDLLNIDAKNKAKNIDDCISELNSIFDYLKLEPGHIQIHKPLTNESLVEGHWQPMPKSNDSGILNLVNFMNLNS